MPLNDKDPFVNALRAKEIIEYLEKVKITIASQQHTKMLDEMCQIEKALAQSKEKMSEIKAAEQGIETELQNKKKQLEATNKAITDYLEYQKKLEEEFNKVQKNIMNLGTIREKEIIEPGEIQKSQSNLQNLLQNLQNEQETLQKTLTDSKDSYPITPQVHSNNIEPIETSSLIANISESLSGKEDSNDFSKLIEDIESKISEAAEQKKADPPQANQQQNINKENQPEPPNSNAIDPPKEQPEKTLKPEEKQLDAISQKIVTQDMELDKDEKILKLREEAIELIKKSHGSP